MNIELTPEQHEFARICQEIHDEIDNSVYEAIELAFLRGHGKVLNTNTGEGEPTIIEDFPMRTNYKPGGILSPNQIALRKIEDYIKEHNIPGDSEIYHTLHHVIDWLQQENK